MAAEYTRIGAKLFPEALGELIEYTVARFGQDPTVEQIMMLSDDPIFEALDRKHTLKFEEYCDEMEKVLVSYIAQYPDVVQIRTGSR